MHEYALMANLMQQIADVAKAEHASRIISVGLDWCTEPPLGRAFC
jgi:Zn finger protein HypA/HybF involved in hydrogenase expression